MTQLMGKGKIVEEVDKEIKNNTSKQGWHFDEYTEGYLDALKNIKTFLDTLEVDVDLENSMVCKVGWYDGFFLDYTQEQQDALLEKIGATCGDKIRVILIKE